MSKLYFKFFLLLLLIFLAGCSVRHTKNLKEESYNTSNQESMTHAELNEVQTLEQTIQAQKYDVEGLLNKESYELIWDVEEKEFPDIVDSWKISSVDMDALWERMKLALFPDGRIQSDERGSGERIIQIKTDDETIDVRIENNDIAINGIDLEKKRGFYEKLAEFLSKETGMDCVERTIPADNDVKEGYLFQINHCLVDSEGYPRGEEWVSGSFCEINGDGSVAIVGIIKKQTVSKSLDLKSMMSVDDLKVLCEMQWASSGFPFVCVLENLKLVYMQSEDGLELIPAYCLNGNFYQKDSDGNITSKRNSFLVNAVTGEIVRFV